MTISAQRGVFMSADDAAYIAEALRLLARLMAEQRAQPSARLVAATTNLAKAAESGSATGPNGSEGLPLRASAADSVHHPGYALMSTGDAARLLHCGPRNVRDLMRRGRLVGRRAGGRWLVDAASVEAHASRKAARRKG